MLGFEEARVLGVLVEKSLTTPDQMPLSLNACVLGCNQSSNRHPITHLDEQEVDQALETLIMKHLAVKVHAAGSRVPKYDARAGMQWELEREDLSILSILLLRGDQTPGELSTRSKRVCPDITLDTVTRHHDGLASREMPFVQQLERQPGQKEARWTCLLLEDQSPEPAAPPEKEGQGLDELRQEVAELKTELHQVRDELHQLKQALGHS